MIPEVVLVLALVGACVALRPCVGWLVDVERARAREEYLEELDRAYREACTPGRVTDHEDSMRGPIA